jgi:hypothetical protein
MRLSNLLVTFRQGSHRDTNFGFDIANGCRGFFISDRCDPLRWAPSRFASFYLPVTAYYPEPSHQQACFESESSAISRGASANEAIAVFIAEVRA